MSTESQKTSVPLFVEIIGEAAVGKTHLACLFPKPAVVDTTKTRESYAVMRKLLTDWKERYFPVTTLEEIRNVLKKIEEKKTMFRTVVIDTSADLRDMGSTEYLKEKSNASKERVALMPLEYKWVNERIDEISHNIRVKMTMNLVHLAQMKDEYTGKGNSSEKTGKRIRKGYPNANAQADVRLLLKIEQEVDAKTMRYTEKLKRTCVVVKNRFKDQVAPEWVATLEPINWSALITKLTDLKEGEIVE